MDDRTRRLLALCALSGDDGRLDWSLIAREAVRHGGLDRLYRGELLEHSADARKALPLLRQCLDLDMIIPSGDLDRAYERVDAELIAAEKIGARLVTVLDDSYPVNLRLIPNLPPFLFFLGADLDSSAVLSVAVVGTRKPTDRGIDLARLMAQQLVENGVTVVSGLAAGIDTAAHTATLDAGGRTLAVIGTGITRTYPKENAGLSQRIIDSSGTVISQFWPTSSPARWTFPRRNAVMSGISQGTVVVEASSTSGAKMQARLALEHGKRVFLLHSLVTDHLWAQNYLTRGAIEVGKVSDVVDRLTPVERVQNSVAGRQQLALFDDAL